MEFLILFETVEGQTGKIVERVDQQIRAAGHSVRSFNTENRLAPLVIPPFVGLFETRTTRPFYTGSVS